MSDSTLLSSLGRVILGVSCVSGPRISPFGGLFPRQLHHRSDRRLQTTAWAARGPSALAPCGPHRWLSVAPVQPPGSGSQQNRRACGGSVSWLCSLACESLGGGFRHLPLAAGQGRSSLPLRMRILRGIRPDPRLRHPPPSYREVAVCLTPSSDAWTCRLTWRVSSGGAP